MAPEGACDSANEWLSSMLYDVVWVDQVTSDGTGSRQHKSHWVSSSGHLNRQQLHKVSLVTCATCQIVLRPIWTGFPTRVQCRHRVLLVCHSACGVCGLKQYTGKTLSSSGKGHLVNVVNLEAARSDTFPGQLI